MFVLLQCLGQGFFSEPKGGNLGSHLRDGSNGGPSPATKPRTVERKWTDWSEGKQ